jgi:hypothetical protein
VESYINHTTGKADENSIFNGDIAKSEASLQTILQIMSLTLFAPLNQLVTNAVFNTEGLQMPNQLNVVEEISGQ